MKSRSSCFLAIDFVVVFQSCKVLKIIILDFVDFITSISDVASFGDKKVLKNCLNSSKENKKIISVGILSIKRVD